MNFSLLSQDRVICVFVSSTFRDMHEERDYLVTVIFPELRERVERLELEFFDVDLRWGIDEKQSASKKTLKLLDEIHTYHRLFIDVLDESYGCAPCGTPSPPTNLKSNPRSRGVASLSMECPTCSHTLRINPLIVGSGFHHAQS